jgi:hypothetical protein
MLTSEQTLKRDAARSVRGRREKIFLCTGPKTIAKVGNIFSTGPSRPAKEGNNQRDRNNQGA